MRLEPPPVRSSPIGLTPIIDVVFLLLMFFMLASTFSRFAHVDIALGGRVGDAAAADAIAIVLSVTGEGFFVDGAGVSQDGIAEALKASAGSRDARVLLRPATDAVAADIVQAIEQARASGVGRVVLVR